METATIDTVRHDEFSDDVDVMERELTDKQKKLEKRKLLALNPKNSPKWLVASNRAGVLLEKMRCAEKTGNQANVKKYFNMHVDSILRNNKKYCENICFDRSKKLDQHYSRGDYNFESDAEWVEFCCYCECGLYAHETRICVNCQVDLTKLKTAWEPTELTNVEGGN